MVRKPKGKHPLYYEAILQLRDITKPTLKFIEDEISRNKIHLAKVKFLENGVDFYFADNKQARHLGKMLQNQLGGELNITVKLYGQKQDREVFRTTILFRESHVRKNDLVSYRGENYRVLGLGREIFLQNTADHQKLHLKYKELKNIKLVN